MDNFIVQTNNPLLKQLKNCTVKRLLITYLPPIWTIIRNFIIWSLIPCRFISCLPCLSGQIWVSCRCLNTCVIVCEPPMWTQTIICCWFAVVLAMLDKELILIRTIWFCNTCVLWISTFSTMTVCFLEAYKEYFIDWYTSTLKFMSNIHFKYIVNKPENHVHFVLRMPFSLHLQMYICQHSIKYDNVEMSF